MDALIRWSGETDREGIPEFTMDTLLKKIVPMVRNVLVIFYQ